MNTPAAGAAPGYSIRQSLQALGFADVNIECVGWIRIRLRPQQSRGAGHYPFEAPLMRASPP